MGAYVTGDQALNQEVNAGTPTVTTVAVTTASTAVLAANSSRRAVIFSNPTANPIYLNLAGGTAVATNMLVPAGGSPVMLKESLCPTGAITGIAGTATSNLSVTEIV